VTIVQTGWSSRSRCPNWRQYSWPSSGSV
jgi:hypothetical protein